MLRLITLGSLELRDEAGTSLLARRRKPLVLLTYLAWTDGWHPRGELATLLWGERDESRARNSLRQALFQLRNAIGDGLDMERERVRLRSHTVELDARLFEEEARSRPARAVERWGGVFLPDADDLGTEVFRTWLDARRASLRGRYVDALQSLAAEASDRGAWSEVLEHGAVWANVAPLDEAPHAALVRALRALGRHEEAAARHAAFMDRYRSELGESPSPAFVAMQAEAAEARLRHSPGSAALFSPDLVGRGDGLAKLRLAWETVRQGGTGAVLVRGEAGIGKTRLCAEFLRWLDRESGATALILRAQAVSSVRGDGLTMARDLLAPLRDAPGLSGASDQALAELARVLPSVRGRYPDLPAATGTMPALRDAVIRVIADVAVEVPVVLCVDDLSRAETESQELVLSLLRRMPPWTLLLVTARKDEVAAIPELAEPEHMWNVVVLEPGPLDIGDMDALMASMLPMPDAHRRILAERLCAETGGNPFYAIELIRTLVDEGHLVSDERGIFEPQAVTGATLPLPASVQESVVRRIERLEPDARLVLGGAAVLERFRRPSLLARVVKRPLAVVARSLDALIARRMLHISEEGFYEFAHPLVQRAAYEHIPPHDRQRLHRRAAHVMASRRYRTTESGATQRYHFRKGGQRIPHRARRLAWTTTLLAGAVVTALAGTRLASLTSDDPPIVSVAEVRDLSGPGPLAESMPQLLSTALARVDGLHVISTDRLYELSTGVPVDSSTRLITAARRAGADQVLVGELSRLDGEWRLTLRRTDLATGVVKGAYVVEAPEPMDLVESAAARVARDLGLKPPQEGAEGSISLAANKLYKQGLRAYYRGDYQAADQLFEAALTTDSTFAMAAYYASRSLSNTNVPRAHALLTLARRMADHAPPPQRLLIRGMWADMYDEPARLAIAETLAIRYPEDPDGQLLYGRALTGGGRFLEAVPHLWRVIQMDSASLHIPGGRCRACDAYQLLPLAYRSADSMAAADRVARQWVARDTSSARPWSILADVLEDEGRLDSALVARRRAQALRATTDPYDITYPGQIALMAGRYAEADERLGELTQSGDAAIAAQARWLQIINLRYQGRLREALDVARQFRADADSSLPRTGPVPFEALPTAQVLWEMGRTEAAAALFDSLASSLATPRAMGRAARMRAWYLTHVAGALASGGDTARLAVLADSIERLGKRSAYGRDRLLFHHVRGLLLAARGDDAGAAAEFKAAIVSESQGYTRTNYQLAKVLLRLGRPDEAIAQLLPVFGAPIDASNYYLSRTDVYTLLGKAEQAAGHRAMAIHYDEEAARAWRRGDPPFRARRDSVLARLRVLQAKAPGSSRSNSNSGSSG
ncbi:MAG: AAA family ATPase [Gemmatimonadota bacterium]